MNWGRRIILLASVLALGAVVPAAPALAETPTLAATCGVDIVTDGVRAPRITVDGSFQLAGSASASVRVGEQVVASGFQFRVALDWAVLGPELTSRGVTRFDNGSMLAAWLDWVENGVQDWPIALDRYTEYPDIAGFPVEQLGTGISTAPLDLELRAPVAPGVVELSNYGDVYVDLHKYTSPQVAVTARCVPVAGQDQRYGQVTVLP